MKTLFEHRHYVEIARIIAGLGDSDDGYSYDREDIAAYFAECLASTNPRFDYKRFFNAAMGEPSGRDKP